LEDGKDSESPSSNVRLSEVRAAGASPTHCHVDV